MNATIQSLRTSPDTQSAQIYLNVIAYNRQQILYFCALARQLSHLRETMLARARVHAQDIQRTLLDWRIAEERARDFAPLVEEEEEEERGSRCGWDEELEQHLAYDEDDRDLFPSED